MKTHRNRQGQFRWLLSIGAVASTLALVFGGATPALAAGYGTSVYGFEDDDPDGQAVAAIIRWHYDQGGSVPRYQAHFYAHGENLVIRDDYADGHAAKVTVKVYEGTTVIIDTDTYYVGTAESGKSINLGTPDGSGDISENRYVSIKLCINETTVCTETVYGRA